MPNDRYNWLDPIGEEPVYYRYECPVKVKTLASFEAGYLRYQDVVKVTGKTQCYNCEEFARRGCKGITSYSLGAAPYFYCYSCVRSLTEHQRTYPYATATFYDEVVRAFDEIECKAKCRILHITEAVVNPYRGETYDLSRLL